MNKGSVQLTLSTVMLAVSFVVGPMVAYFSAQAATEEKIAKVEKNVAVLENSISNTDRNVIEIKNDIKDLKIYFNIK